MQVYEILSCASEVAAWSLVKSHVVGQHARALETIEPEYGGQAENGNPRREVQTGPDRLAMLQWQLAEPFKRRKTDPVVLNEGITLVSM